MTSNVGVQAAMIKVCMTASLRAAWTSTSTLVILIVPMGSLVNMITPKYCLKSKALSGVEINA